MEEAVKKKLRNFEVQVDQMVEEVQKENPDLTKEVNS